MVKTFLLTTLLLLPGFCRAEEVRLPCIADTSVSSYPSETEMNYGRATHLRLKGIQMLALLDFDLKPAGSLHVDGATLFLRYAGADRKLRTLGCSTVAAPWTEGTGEGERREGETSFAWASTGKSTWAGPMTDFTDVSFTAGHTIAGYAEVTDRGDGWISAEVPPRIVQAMIAGMSYGMVVSDEKGQTMANNDVFSREQSNSQPYLVVRGTPARIEPAPGASDMRVSADPARADFETGALRVSLRPPTGAFGYRVSYSIRGEARPAPRYEIPLAAAAEQTFNLAGLPPGKTVEWVEVVPVSETGAAGAAVRVSAPMIVVKPRPAELRAGPGIGPGQNPPELAGRFRVWAYPGETKAHPVSGNLLEEVGIEKFAGPPAGEYRRRNAVWDGRTIRLSGARGEAAAFNVCIEALAGSLDALEVAAGPLATQSGAGLHGTWNVSRCWYVRDREWMPEIAVPGSRFDIPAKDNAVPGQRNQSVYVELQVPKSAGPGVYSGALSIGWGVQSLRFPVELTVSDATLPDNLSFDVSLNGYGTVGHLFGIDDRTPEYRNLEREYHRMAHRNRTTLALLGYSHSGNVTTNYAPPLVGEGASMHVADWSAWDEQFGPYLDGSAFADLPRSGVPVTHLYLPFHEDWPSDIRKHYHYTPTVTDYPATIVEHALKAPPIEQAMDETFRQEFVAVMRDSNSHFREKGWTRTAFQFYNNDKNYYKDPKQGGQGTSWWLLDEPNYRDDWQALGFLGRLYRQAVDTKGPIIYREDISRPEWQRDYLHDLVDLMVVGGAIFRKQPMLREMQRMEHVRYWNYGTANEVRASNLQMEAWAIKAWLNGADGIVPWNSIGSDQNYTQPDATALILPGKRFGLTGPVASLRLKALRRAQQDVEYLVLLAKAKGWDRDQVAAALQPILELKVGFKQSGADDAGKYEFGTLKAEAFDEMRRAIAAALRK